MSLQTPGELEASVDNLRGSVAQIFDEMERLKREMGVTEAGLSHHQHDFTRDVTGRPSTYPAATHTHAAYADATHNHNASYSALGHTHAYASNTHAHTYLDAQPTIGGYTDATRTTGGPV